MSEASDYWGTGPLAYTDSHTRAIVLADLLESAPTPEHAWRRFAFGWEMCDAVPGPLATEILAMLPREPKGTDYLDVNAQAFFEALDDEFIVYRGSAPGNARSCSWTTDLDVALGFAEGHRGILVPGGAIFGAEIRKTQVLTVLVERQESTVILDPTQLPIFRAFTIEEAKDAIAGHLPTTSTAALGLKVSTPRN